jgi:hypothetical protein
MMIETSRDFVSLFPGATVSMNWNDNIGRVPQSPYLVQ